MDFELTPEEKAFQKEVREFLDEHCTEKVVAETESMLGEGPYSKELIRKMGARNMLAPRWPEEYGGRGMGFMAETIKVHELTYHRGPFPLDGVEIGNTLLMCGTEEQKNKFLPGIARGEIEFALGYTEPNAGSDVASVQLRAVDNGDKFILIGQKIYNTEAHFSEYHWLLTRTDPSAEKKHRGLTMLMVDLKSPGITIRPLVTSAGLRTNEVFYEDVHVPKANMVGEKNGGWAVIMSALYGGMGGGSSGASRFHFETLMKYLLEEKPEIAAENPWIPDAMADIYIKLHLIDVIGLRASAMSDLGLATPYDGPVSHIFGNESRRQFCNVVMQILGPYGQLAEGSKYAPLRGVFLRQYMDSPRWTIVHGSSEIQRLVIATRGLGLPRK
ncbi:MAG TPA: acyl-CoA dehydrogenase family protein [Dehalococcoidales bacterium]|nr:acyl-CoA dehydrogenase family protein [Dehalococcoidales bacterium]